jgi:hypothetical protein
VRCAIKEEVKARIQHLKQTEYGKEFLMCMEDASAVADVNQYPRNSIHSGVPCPRVNLFLPGTFAGLITKKAFAECSCKREN